MARVLDRVLPALPFPFRIDAATLSHDQARVADYREDVDIHATITPRLFTETLAAIDQAFERGDRITVPVHLLLAGDDRIVDTARSLAFARALDPVRASVEVVEDRYHELLQEQDRDRTMAVIRAFLEEHMG
jgi:lysophospholipase